MFGSTITRPERAAPKAALHNQTSTTSSGSAGRGIGHWLRSGASTILVLGLLGGIAFWGHSTDWTLPKFSALVGGSSVKSEGVCAQGEGGWCAEHNVPESECIECNPKLRAPATDYGWCAQHGLAQCPLEHPEVAQLKNLPTVTGEEVARVDRALALLPRTENNSNCKNYQKRIQFASVEALDKAGVDIAVVDQRPIVEAVSANGEVVYDDTHTAHLASRVPGTVWRVEKQVGQPVQKGEVLALVESADVGRLKSEFLQAIAEQRLKQATLERLQPLASSGAIAGRSAREADAALQEAQIRLLSAQQALVNLGLPVNAEQFGDLSVSQIAKKIQFLGLPSELVSNIDSDSTTSNLLPLRSALDGMIVDCHVVPGENVDSNTMLFRVSDLRKLWLVLDVKQEDCGYLSVGQSAFFRGSERGKEQDIRGTISWISTEADDKTRTVKVRVELPNTDGRLRANTFGTGRIVLREEPRAVVVPTEAIHSDGDCKIVFVRDKDFLHEGAPKFFHIREVRTGVQDADSTEVIAGLLPGEIIASKNSTVLEAQLLKSNLGAGCGCCSPGKK